MGATSWQVKRKYNEKHYKKVVADIERELVIDLEFKLKQSGISKAEFIRQSIKSYLTGKLIIIKPEDTK